MVAAEGGGTRARPFLTLASRPIPIHFWACSGRSSRAPAGMSGLAAGRRPAPGPAARPGPRHPGPRRLQRRQRRGRPRRARSAGPQRRRGPDRRVRRRTRPRGGTGSQQLWLATTDADSTVPADWLAEQLRLAALGVEVVAGAGPGPVSYTHLTLPTK